MQSKNTCMTYTQRIVMMRKLKTTIICERTLTYVT